MLILRATTVLATALLLAGCTSSGSSDDPPDSPASGAGPSATATGSAGTATGPSCAQVWRAGATLPRDYTGCTVDGRAGRQDVVTCDDDTSLVVYADAYWAVTGGRIVKPKDAPLQDSAAYGTAYEACTGE